MTDVVKGAMERLERVVSTAAITIAALNDADERAKAVRFRADWNTLCAAIEQADAHADRLAEALREMLSERGSCPGLSIGDGNYSGCSAAQTGANDCPTCGPLVDHDARREKP